MANEIVIEAEPRTLIGKKVKKLRRQGITPAIIYGGEEPISIQVDTLTTFLTLRDADANDILTIDVAGKKHKVITRDIQRHVTRGDLVHVDFQEVTSDTVIRTEAAIVTVGQSAPEAEGLGTTSQLLFAVEIEASADALISEIEVDLTQIVTTEDQIMVSDLVVPQGVTILTADDIPVAKFDFERVAEEEEEGEIEEGIEPEVIGAVDEDESESV
ncbi:MAG: 50S ribosomal protein L25 [Ardenticatenaceae bacterium]|nr:50S ribosomal protein L25 [Ardenticatenaceae bacterium]